MVAGKFLGQPQILANPRNLIIVKYIDIIVDPWTLICGVHDSVVSSTILALKLLSNYVYVAIQYHL